MIRIGINGPLVLTGATIADKGWLELIWKDVAEQEKPKVDAFDALNSEEYAETGDPTNKTTLFPPLPPFEKKKDGSIVPQADRAIMANEALAELKNTLLQIMLCYMTSDKIKWDNYKGTGLTRENMNDLITTEDMLKMVSRNMFETFISLVTPFLGDETIPVRLFMVRQSKDKHFPSFRSKFVKDNPIIELAAIPETDTKLKFTSYEIKQGLDKDTVVSTSTDPVPDDVPADMEAKNIFNQQ